MNNLPNKNYDKEIDLGDLFKVLWKKKFYIGAIVSIFLLISTVYALYLPNIYKSQIILMPVESNSQMSGMLGQYSGMASLAGISLPGEPTSQSNEAIARIKSFEFFSNHFLPHIALEDLMAIKKWNPTTNTPIYDEKAFNSETRKWVRKADPPRSITPSSQEAYEEYREIIGISEDKLTSFISLYIKHKSPLLAQEWVELIVKQIDKIMRDEARYEATKKVEYLNSLAPTVKYEGIKRALSSLQEEQLKNLMMVEASENYVFKVLDPPLVPEIKSEPSRSLIVMLGLTMGMIISILFFLALHFIRSPIPK